MMLAVALQSSEMHFHVADAHRSALLDMKVPATVDLDI